MVNKKLLLRNSILFLILLFFLFFLINVSYNNLIIKNKSIYINEIQYSQSSNFNILIMGDSHAAYGLNPTFINNSFNFANPLESYDQTFFKLKKIIFEKNISIILIPFDYHSFSDYRSEKYKDIWYWSNYLNYSELEILSEKDYKFLFILNNFPILGNGADFINLFISEKTNISNGWFSSNKNFNNINPKLRQDLSDDRVLRQFPNKKMIDKKLLLYFNKTINLALGNNISIFLVKYPISIEYQNSISNLNNSNFYYDLENNIDDYNITILDYQNLFDTNQNYFFDQDHLNSIGAKNLSILINLNLNLKS